MASTPEERDWLTLNAYMDGDLPAEARQALESRLALDAALRADLESLRTTVRLLGMAERKPVPRNFTLDPAVYGRAARSWWIGLGLSPLAPLLTSGAALLAVLALAGALLPAGGGRVFEAGAPMAAADVPMETAAQAPAVEPAAGETMMLEAPLPEGESAENDAAAMEPADSGAAPVEEAAPPAAADAVGEDEGEDGSAVGGTGGGAEQPPHPTPTPQPTEEPATRSPDDDTVARTAEPTATLAVAVPSEIQPEEPRSTSAAASPPPLLFAGIGLGLLAVAGAALMIAARRG